MGDLRKTKTARFEHLGRDVRAHLELAESGDGGVEVWSVTVKGEKLCTVTRKRVQSMRITITNSGSTSRFRMRTAWFVSELPNHGGFDTRKGALEAAANILGRRNADR